MHLGNLLYVIILGIIEGITEWLPISSTGHLLIIERLLIVKIDNNIFNEAFNEMFTVVIQLGAILAVLSVFLKKLWPIKKHQILWLKLLIASIPIALLGLLFDDLFDKWFYNPLSISVTLIIYGLIFLWVEKDHLKGQKHDDISMRLALIIGVAQCLALIPGTSRSGVTIVAMLLLGVNRQTSVEFSFLLSVPVMFGASGLKIIKFLSVESLMTSQFILLTIGEEFLMILNLKRKK